MSAVGRIRALPATGSLANVTVDPSLVLAPGPWTHRMVAANGGRFHVALSGAVDGEAPLVLLLHGFPQFWWAWREQLEPLARAGYRVAAMDLRGYAGSDKPPSAYSIPAMAADVRGVIRSLGAAQAVVVGHGVGAQVAWSMPGISANTTRAVVALSAPHPVPAHRRMNKCFSAEAIRALARFQVPWFPERALTQGGLVAELLQSWSATERPAPEVEMYTQAMRLPFVAHSAMEQIRWWVRSTPRLDGRRYLASVARPITVPVLSLQGSADPLYRLGAFRHDQDFTSGRYARLTIDGAGHFLPEEAPGEVTDLLLEWLADLD